MLSRKLRVPSDTLKDARGFSRRSSPFFTVRFKDNNLALARFAVVVSSRTSKSSVVRHNLKRRVSAKLVGLSKPGGRDIIVSVLPKSIGLSRKEFIFELEKILKQI